MLGRWLSIGHGVGKGCGRGQEIFCGPVVGAGDGAIVTWLCFSSGLDVGVTVGGSFAGFPFPY